MIVHKLFKTNLKKTKTGVRPTFSARLVHTMTKRVLVPIANGSEDIESVCIIDTLRRANADVVVASVEPTKQVVCARKTKIEADTLIGDVKDQDFDLIALPGGMPGAEHLRDCSVLIQMLKKQSEQKKLFAAVCAAPAVVFETHGLLKGHQGTAHPGHSQKLADQAMVEERVVVSKNCITSRGPGTSLEFSLKLVELLYNREEAEKIQKAMLVPSF